MVKLTTIQLVDKFGYVIDGPIITVTNRSNGFYCYFPLGKSINTFISCI